MNISRTKLWTMCLFGGVLVLTLFFHLRPRSTIVEVSSLLDAPWQEAHDTEPRFMQDVMSPWSSRGCTNPTPKRWYSQLKEDKLLHQLLYKDGVCKGTFVEIGALDGKYLSNTKTYEDELQWTGLLIEAEPRNAAALKINRPHVHTVHSATCNDSQTTVKFAGSKALGGVIKSMSNKHVKGWHIDTSKYVEVPCAPLGKLLQRADLTAVDMFVLDVEGGEYEVLRTMDWRVPVGVWVVELNGQDVAKDTRVRTLLKQHSYVEVPVKGMNVINSVFLHPSYRSYLGTLKIHSS